MSYDLMVFDPKAAPKDQDSFMEWYDDITQWSEPHDYASPHILSDALAAFYEILRLDFPPLNGPHAVSDDRLDDPEVTDYTISEHAIYLAFAWSMSAKARTAVLKAAERAQVGFFDVSAEDGAVAHTPLEVKALREQQ